MTESITLPDSLTIHFTNDRFSTLCGQAILSDTPVVFRHLHPSGYAPTYLCEICEERHEAKPRGQVIYRYDDEANTFIEYDEA